MRPERQGDHVRRGRRLPSASMTDEETPKAPDPEELVRFEIRNQVAWITIDNPDKGNALSPEMRDRMAGLILSLIHI